jgi:hypothetical protein
MVDSQRGKLETMTGTETKTDFLPEGFELSVTITRAEAIAQVRLMAALRWRR